MIIIPHGSRSDDSLTVQRHHHLVSSLQELSLIHILASVSGDLAPQDAAWFRKIMSDCILCPLSLIHIWVFSALFGLYTLFPAAPWVFPILFGLHTFSAAAPWVFPALSDFSYPRNTEILCMLFSYNTQDSIGKRFPQPFL